MLFLMLCMEDMVKTHISRQYIEAEKIKYTHSGVISSFKAMDKTLSKKIFKKNKILTLKKVCLLF